MGVVCATGAVQGREDLPVGELRAQPSCTVPRHCTGGVDADGEIVERELHDLPAGVDRTAGVIGECLEIGNEDGLVVLVLERQTGVQ